MPMKKDWLHFENMNFFCIENANLVHPRCKRGRGGGTVNVYLNNPTSTGIWNTVEKPILQQRGIHIIYR